VLESMTITVPDPAQIVSPPPDVTMSCIVDVARVDSVTTLPPAPVLIVVLPRPPLIVSLP
jgi:hypothetical protein